MLACPGQDSARAIYTCEHSIYFRSAINHCAQWGTFFANGKCFNGDQGT